MSIEKFQYEELLATYSQSSESIALLKHYRAYLEMLPSMRRPEESVITIPMPIVQIRHSTSTLSANTKITVAERLLLPCDLAILMCDPEWKVKTGQEIFVFIHRPNEDFSDLLGRWRRTQVMLGRDYEWVLPPRHQHILNDGAEKNYPLFVVFEETPERIKRGLQGAHLPCVTQTTVASQTSKELDLSQTLNASDTVSTEEQS